MTKHISEKFTHIVIGIVTNSEGEVLVSKRRVDVHLGGMLEFPGGKLERNETPQEALMRELNEELGIGIISASRLIQFYFIYSDKKIFLDVYKVLDYSGRVSANEGQELDWINISTLRTIDFPDANFGIIRALQLPTSIAVTPDVREIESEFLKKFEILATKKELEVIHFRSHKLSDTRYLQVAKKCLEICLNFDTKLILNRDTESVLAVQAHGLHLTSKRLLSLKQRPLADHYLVSASCHNDDEIKHASDLSLDYVFLGPVLEKNSNQKVKLLGLNLFNSIVKKSQVPVFAIGGLKTLDIEKIVQHGGQGIAAIRDFWSNS